MKGLLDDSQLGPTRCWAALVASMPAWEAETKCNSDERQLVQQLIRTLAVCSLKL